MTPATFQEWIPILKHGYMKLAFPAYFICLVVLVIIISSYTFKFSNLVGKKNPVACLATLVLLSYAKLLDISFYPLAFWSILMALAKWFGFLMQLSSISLEAHSSVHCSCSHSPNWPGLHCSPLLLAVASLSSKVENFLVVKGPKIANIYRNLPHTIHSQASLLDWVATACSCHLVSRSCCQCFK